MRPRRRAAAASLALLLAIGLAPTGLGAARGAVPGDLFAFDSSGDYLGKDGHEVLTDADSSIYLQAGLAPPGGITVVADHDTHRYRVSVGPALGDELEVGDYPFATRLAVNGEPDIDIGFDGSGCNTASGSFHIYSLSRDGAGEISSIALSYTFDCENEPGLLVGRIRVDSDTPMASLTLPRTSRAFDPIKAGMTSGARTYTVVSDGDVPVTLGTLSMTGDGAATLPISNDECSGATMAPGDTCTYDVRFHPTVPCWCRAVLVMPSSGAPTRRLQYQGSGLVPTTVTLVPRPDLVHLTGGLKIDVTVVPTPGGGEYRCTVDGVMTTESPSTYCLVPRVLGTHTAVAEYLGSADLAPGVSDPVAFTVEDATTASLSATPAVVRFGQSTTLTVRVGTSNDLLFPGGSASIVDQDSGAIVASGPVDADQPTVSATVTLAEGDHHYTARYDHGTSPHEDSTSGTTTATVRSAMAPVVSFVSGVHFSPSSMALTVRWASSDLSDVRSFALQSRTAGGTWKTVSLASPLSRSARVVLAAGKTYEFRVRSTDRLGRTSAWALGDPITPTYYQETTTRAQWSSGWHASSSSSAFGGTTRYSVTKGKSVTFTFTGRAVGLISPLSSGRGSADIYIDGVYVWTASLTQARAVSRQVVVVRSWATSGTHSMKIVLNGHQHPRFDIDAFEIIR